MKLRDRTFGRQTTSRINRGEYNKPATLILNWRDGLMISSTRMVWSAAAILAAALGTSPARAQEKVLKVVPHADLKVLDPVNVTAAITYIHGLMIYDSLMALDANLTPQPQMAQGVDVSADKLTY